MNKAAYKLPFYQRQPLYFECTACGRCCVGGGDSHVFLSQPEADNIRSYLGLTAAWFRRRYLLRLEGEESGDGELVLQSRSNGQCIFLGENGRCRVYPVRPAQCSSYPFWPENLKTAKAWRQEARRCEGIGKGAAIPLVRIEDSLRSSSESSS